MLAVGKLTAVWVDLPDAGDGEFFKGDFGGFFGAPWEQVMVGAEKPFDYHRYWDGYFAVTALEDSPGLTLADLPVSVSGHTKQLYYNIIVG